MSNNGAPLFLPNGPTRATGTELRRMGLSLPLGKLHGMSLSDWLAGQAMQGLIADTEFPFDHDGLAKAAYDIADTMLEARKQSC